MNRTQCRFVIRKNTLLALSALFVGCSLASVAQAEQRLEGDEAFDKLTKPVSTMEVGAGYVSKDSFKAGDYTGLNNEGAYAIGNLDLRGGAAYDSASALRWRVKGENLGLDSRRVDAEYGEQGKYRIKAGYSEIPKLRSDSYQTPYNGTGSTYLTKPAGWVNTTAFAGTAASTTANMPQLAASMHPVPIETERKKGDAGLSVFVTSALELKANYSEEHKSGNKLIGNSMWSSPSASSLLVEPNDFNTRQFDASLNYNSKKGQFRLGYYGSLFDNKNTGLQFDNLFYPTGGTPATTNAATLGQLGLAPDNEFHKFDISGNYKFDRTTRLALKASRSTGTQNQPFLPYMADNNLKANGTLQNPGEGIPPK